MSAITEQIADGDPVAVRISKTVSLAITRGDQVLSVSTTWYFACFAVIAFQFALIATHRPWLDEWQALQIALQSPTIASLFENLRYEGHPPLWYLILRGLAAVLPWQAVLPTAAAIIALAAQYIVLFRSPFSKAERLLVATSELVLFEYLTLSRSMNLGVLMLLAAVAFWRSRWVWLAIAVLPMCDFLFGVLSVCLVALKWRDRSLWLPGLAVWILTGLLSAYCVIPAPDVIPALMRNGFISDLGSYLSRIGTILLPFQMEGMKPTWNGMAPFFLGAPLSYFLAKLAWQSTASDPAHRLVLFAFIAVTLLFSLVVYPLHFRHLSLIGLLIILLCWLRAVQGEQLGEWLRLWLASMSLCGLLVAGINLVIPFDTANLVANAITRRGLEHEHWMVFPDSRAQGVSALTGMAFERTEAGCMQNFIRWNFRSKIETKAQYASFLRQALQQRGQFYLLSEFPVPLPPEIAKPIEHIPAGYDGQEFYIVQIGPNEPKRQINLPDCIPGIRPLDAARLR